MKFKSFKLKSFKNDLKFHDSKKLGNLGTKLFFGLDLITGLLDLRLEHLMTSPTCNTCIRKSHEFSTMRVERKKCGKNAYAGIDSIRENA